MLITPISVIQSDSRNLFYSSHIFQDVAQLNVSTKWEVYHKDIFFDLSWPMGKTLYLYWFYWTLSKNVSLLWQIFGRRYILLGMGCCHEKLIIVLMALYWLYWPLIQRVLFSHIQVDHQCSIIVSINSLLWLLNQKNN